MNTDLLKIIAGLLVLVSTASAECDNAKQERNEKALLDMENRWVTALDRRDPKAIDCLLADEFLDSDASGQLRTRQQVLDAVPNRKTYAQHLEDLRTSLYGDIGIVRGVNRVTDKDGKEVARVRFTDVFRYRNGQWRAVAGHETMVEPANKGAKNKTAYGFRNQPAGSQTIARTRPGVHLARRSRALGTAWGAVIAGR